MVPESQSNSIIATCLPRCWWRTNLILCVRGESLEDFWDTQIGYAESSASSTSFDLATIDGLELGFQSTYYWAIQAT